MGPLKRDQIQDSHVHKVRNFSILILPYRNDGYCKFSPCTEKNNNIMCRKISEELQFPYYHLLWAGFLGHLNAVSGLLLNDVSGICQVIELCHCGPVLVRGILGLKIKGQVLRTFPIFAIFYVWYLWKHPGVKYFFAPKRAGWLSMLVVHGNIGRVRAVLKVIPWNYWKLISLK